MVDWIVRIARLSQSKAGGKMRTSLGLRTLLFLMTLTAHLCAQDSNAQVRIPVKFECNCTDEVGQLYATAFRDVLAKSPRFIADAGFQKGGGSSDGPPSILVNVVSLDPFNQGQASALSIAFLLGNTTYLTHIVRWCPKDRASSCAASTFAEMDDQVQRLLDLSAKDKK